MSTLTPEQVTGTRCGAMVESGIVAFRCEREAGHTMVPETDPEPHYAVEVGRSVRAWQAWRQRQIEREANPSISVLGGVSCPTCAKAMRLSDLGAVCVDPTCSQAPIHIAGQSVATSVAEGSYSPDEMTNKAYLVQRPGKDAAWEDVTDLVRINASDMLESYSCPRSVVHDHHFWGLKDEAPVFQCKGDLSDPPVVAKDDPAYAAEEAGFVLEAEPTKQREGDQPLPEGGHLCVQDRIIEEMEESKRVGEIRYGSVLRTFNGRDSLLDAAEEARDLHVYLTQIRMEAEVTREQLEVVVANRIRPLLGPWGADDEGVEAIASIAVDAVMGWVTGQPAQEAHSLPAG